MKLTPVLALMLALAVGSAAAAQSGNVHEVVVTAVPRHSGEQEPIGQAAVRVEQDGKNDAVRAWQAVNDQTTVDLAIIIDEDTQNIGVQLGDVRTFIKGLPTNVRVGIGYMSTGTILFAQSAFTPDRNLALLKLRLPSGAGNASPSPYSSVQFLMQHWRPRAGQVHEMLVISDGIEHLGGNDTNNITLKKAVADTVEAGVVVYAIAATGEPGAGAPGPFGGATGLGGAPNPGIVAMPAGTSDSKGVMNLGELTEATGGMTYSGPNGTPLRFTDILNDVRARLQHQYVLTFDGNGSKTGLQAVKIEVHASDVKVTAPKDVFVGS